MTNYYTKDPKIRIVASVNKITEKKKKPWLKINVLTYPCKLLD